jgi:gas vesicle protein
VKSLLKSILKTAVYVLDQADNITSDVRDRAEQVTHRVSDLADQGRDVIYGEDHTMRNLGLFVAGVGVGVAAGVLLAPSSGDELRSSVRDKVADIGDRVRDRFTPSAVARSTGTEGGI